MELICFSFHQRGLPQFTMMLLLGGDVELNPGDKWKLEKSLKINQKGIQRSATVGSIRSVVASRSLCMRFWRTLRALRFAPGIFPQCGLPNLSDSFFDNSTDSLNSSNFFEPMNVSPPTRERIDIHSKKG